MDKSSSSLVDITTLSWVGKGGLGAFEGFDKSSIAIRIISYTVDRPLIEASRLLAGRKALGRQNLEAYEDDNCAHIQLAADRERKLARLEEERTQGM